MVIMRIYRNIIYNYKLIFETMKNIRIRKLYREPTQVI